MNTLQQSGVNSIPEVISGPSTLSQISSIYLPIRNMMVYLIVSTRRFYYYASGQSLSLSSNPAPATLPSSSGSSTTTQSKQQIVQPNNAVLVSAPKPGVAPVTAVNATTQQTTGSSSNYILLCSDEKRWLTTWEDLNVTEIKSDKELFGRFRAQLSRRKRWVGHFISLKTIQRISFVKVNNYPRPSSEIFMVEPETNGDSVRPPPKPRG